MPRAAAAFTVVNICLTLVLIFNSDAVTEATKAPTVLASDVEGFQGGGFEGNDPRAAVPASLKDGAVGDQGPVTPLSTLRRSQVISLKGNSRRRRMQLVMGHDVRFV